MKTGIDSVKNLKPNVDIGRYRKRYGTKIMKEATGRIRQTQRVFLTFGIFEEEGTEIKTSLLR
jgi:hypothetical protein